MKKTYTKKLTRLWCLLLVVISVCGCITGAHAYAETTEVTEDLLGPIPEQIQMSEDELAQIYSDLGMRIPTRASQGSIPDKMWDNSVLDALMWLGYDVQQQKEDGKLYDSYYTTQYTYANNAYGSGIPYDSVGNSTGCETVASSTSPTGKLPKLSKWQSYGLCCASFASYYLINYLPNVEGSNGDFASALYRAITTNGYYHNPQSPYAWYYGLRKMINDGTSFGGQKVQKFTTSQRAAALAVLQPGDVIIFTSNNNGTIKYNHVAIYIGENADGKHWMANVSNDKGPGLDILEVYEKYYDGKGGDAIFYHLPLVEPQGFIEVYKKDTAGKALSGAEFQAVNNSTSVKFAIGPTNASGYAISEGLPVGTYTVTEMKYPSGYTSYGTTSWTVTVSNGATATVNAVNQLQTGYIQIYKKDLDGNNLSGAEFKAVNSSTKAEYTIGPTNSSGYAVSKAIPLGTYTVTETKFPVGYTCSDTSSWTVTVGSSSSTNTVTVNATNKRITGGIKLIKTTNTGENLSGWSIGIYTDSGLTTPLAGSPFITGEDGTINVTELIPGTYYAKEVASSDPYWVCDSETKTINVTGGNTAEVTFSNSHLGKIWIVKTMESTDPVSGWKFAIYDENGEEVPGSPFLTNDEGVAETGLLEPGWYDVAEIIPDGSFYYCTNEENKTIYVTAGEIEIADFENAVYPANIQIKKTDPYGNPLAGAKFLLEWSYDGNNWQPVTHSWIVTAGGCQRQDMVNGALVSGNNGYVEWTGLHPALYYRVTELEAPNGFSLLSDYAYVGKIPSDGLKLELRVINSPNYTLPHAGSNAMQNMSLAFVCCALLGISAVRLSRRKKT